MRKSIGLFLTSMLFGVAISVSVDAVVAEIRYRREIKKINEIAKTAEEIKIP